MQTISLPVLVTGGTGFLARHTIANLLHRGMTVRTTVRSASRGERLRDGLGAAGVDATGLQFAVADLLDPSGWARAMEGIGGVLHMATPMTGKDVVAAAVDGTRRVLDASADAGIRRIVVTSSGLAASRPGDATSSITEADWTDPQRPGTSDYARAKTLAERAAWSLARDRDLALTTILPGAILGPRLGQDRPGWLALIDGMLQGRMAALPPVRLQMVDVRDLARLHVDALLSPAAEGQRYIAMGESYSFREVAVVLREEFGPAAAKVQTREMPAWLLRLAGLFSAQARQGAALLDTRGTMSASKAHDELDWQTRSVRQSIIDTARSLL